MIVEVDALADARGAEKCKTILDLLGKLAALKSGLMNEEKQKGSDE